MKNTAMTKQVTHELQQIERKVKALEAEIQQSDVRSRSAFTDSIARRLEQGAVLIQAKFKCPAGDWELWCSNLPISKSTIERRMRDARDPSRLTGARAQHEVLTLENGDETKAKASGEGRELLPYLEAIGRGARLVAYIGKHPLTEWPEEGRAKLREDLRPIVKQLGGRFE